MNVVIFEVAPAGPDAYILDVFKGVSKHDENGSCRIGDGDCGGGRCVSVMSVLEYQGSGSRERWYCDVFTGGRRFGNIDGGGNKDSGDEDGAEAVSGGLVSGVAVLSR